MKAVKFNFGNSFDAAAAPRKKTMTYSEDEMKAARAAAFAEGERAGHERAMADIVRRAADAAERIVMSLSALIAEEQARREKARADAAAVGVTAAMKFAPALTAAQPMEEIRAMIAECAMVAYAEPRLVVRVAEPLVDAVKAVTDEIIKNHGYMGKFVLLGDPSLTGSDCRVEWADGGAERNEQEIAAEIERIVGRFIEARRRAAGATSQF